jgi:transcriptional regulator with XRE-family HTH domain
MVDNAGNGALEFAGLLRQHRIRAGLTQRELAESAGVSPGAIRDLEQGRSRNPRPRSVRALAGALALSDVDTEGLLRTALSLDGVRADPVPDKDEPAKLSVLGTLAACRGPTTVSLGDGRRRVVLARLALTPNATVSRDELIDVLWGEQPPPSAVNIVQGYVSRLRRALEPRRPGGGRPELLVLTRTGYELRVDADQLDLLAYRELSERAAADGLSPQESLELLERALGLWRGPIAADVPELRDDPLVTAVTQERIEATIRHARLAGWSTCAA